MEDGGEMEAAGLLPGNLPGLLTGRPFLAYNNKKKERNPTAVNPAPGWEWGALDLPVTGNKCARKGKSSC